MSSNELKDLTRNQLQLKSAQLAGQIDGLVDYRSTLREELEQTVQDIRNLEELRRSVDIGTDQDTLEHLRTREMDLRQEIRDVRDRIEELSEEYDPIAHELAGRPLFDEHSEQWIRERRRETEKQLERMRTSHLGVFGRLRAWLFGGY